MTSAAHSALRVSGVVLPEEEARDLYIVNGRITYEPSSAETVSSNGWILPGLVDAHCHIGLRTGGSAVISADEARGLAMRDRDTGVLAIRNTGSPSDFPALDADPHLPRLIHAGRHLAAPGRYLPGIAHECTGPELTNAVRCQTQAGHRWVKLVADWFDPVAGELSPSWDEDTLSRAIGAAHQAGARVAAHTFGSEAIAWLVSAGVDSIEHGTGLSSDLVAVMSERGIALVPTMLAVQTFRAIAAVAEPRYPRYAAALRDSQRTFPDLIRCAYEAGVPLYIGTDAGSDVAHGRIVDEMLMLNRQAGIPAAKVVAAGSWEARRWLGLPLLEEGAPADLVVYDADPRSDLTVLHDPRLIMVSGHIVKR